MVVLVIGFVGLTRTLFSQLRRGIESLPAATYNTWSYYGKWAASLCRALLEAHVLTQADLDAQLGPVESDAIVRFSPGNIVRVKPEIHSSRWRKPHLRVPGYICMSTTISVRL